MKKIISNLIAKLFVRPLIFLWAWTILVNKFNLTPFGYWEIFAINWAIGNILMMFNTVIRHDPDEEEF